AFARCGGFAAFGGLFWAGQGLGGAQASLRSGGDRSGGVLAAQDRSGVILPGERCRLRWDVDGQGVSALLPTDLVAGAYLRFVITTRCGVGPCLLCGESVGAEGVRGWEPRCRKHFRARALFVALEPCGARACEA